MTVSPNISALLNLIAGIAGVVVTYVGEFTTLFGSGPTAVIIGIATIVAGTVNAVLHATSAPTAGLLAHRQR